MTKYLIRHSFEILKTDGFLVLLREILKYIGLYNTPDKLIKWWIVGLSGKTSAVQKVQGSLMKLNLKDQGIHKDLYLHGIREPQATRYMQSIMQPDWHIVDIGANIGYYALMEARIVKSVVAIEAGRDNATNLQSNISINQYKNIEVFNCAIGDHNGMINFHVSKACNWNRIASGDDSIDESINMYTLDNFIGEAYPVDFIRMDVEGYELNILNGMRNILEQHRPDMFIEVHRDMLKDYGGTQLLLMQFLAEHDYSIRKAYIMGRENINGRIRDLLAHDKTRIEITERGIASHIFFTGGRV